MHRPQPLVLILLAASLLAAGDATAKTTVKPKPVRTALERRYAEQRSAYFAHDSAGAFSVRLPNMFSITASGDTMSPDVVRAYARASFAQVESTLALDWKLGVIDLHGDTAAVELDQHWMRHQLKGGAVRTVETRAQQRETWIRARDEWFLWRVDHVRPGEWRVDGKRIDPSKPYDPNAPEYQPPTK